MVLRRLGPLLLLMYLLVDFSDPALPGVFYFDAPQLFVDGAVGASSAAPEAEVSLPHQPRVPGQALERDRPVGETPPSPSRVRLRRSAQRRPDHGSPTYASAPPSDSPDPH